NRANLTPRSVCCQTPDSGRFTLGEEQVAQCTGLGRRQALQEQLSLALKASLKGKVQRRLHTAHNAVRGNLTPAAPAKSGPIACDNGAVHAAWGQGNIADTAQGRTFGKQASYIGERPAPQVALNGLVDDMACPGLRCWKRVTAGHHVQRQGDAGNTRHALGASRPRQQPEPDLRQPDQGSGSGTAIMAYQRCLQPASQRSAMNGG